MKDWNEIEQFYLEMLEHMHYVKSSEIPNIDLYMDQVTTFMDERLAKSVRDPAHDKILTKTMINNYAKNDLLIPPVKKKYSRDHMILLLMIYYMKSFLAINDIGEILRPIKDHYVGKDGAPIDLTGIYDEIVADLEGEITGMAEREKASLAHLESAFSELPEEDRARLQRFALILQLSAEIYVKKVFIEKLVDEERAARMTEEEAKKTAEREAKARAKKKA